MRSRSDVRRLTRAALVLSGVLTVATGCSDEPGAGQTALPPAPTGVSMEHRAPRADTAPRPRMPKELWVTSQGSSVLYIRHFENLTAIDKITLPANSGPHITTFHTPNFAYVGGMTDGNVYVIDANRREIVQTIKVAPTLAHQVKVAPDGKFAFVTAIGTRTVTRLQVDEAAHSWTLGNSLDIGAATGKAPICTVFRSDSKRAFVSLNPSGIAVVDVATMTVVSQIATDGFVACGMIKTDNNRVVLASTGGGGHVYTLDLTTEQLTDRGTLGAPSWHSFNMTADGTRGFGSSPTSDEVIVIDLTTTPVTNQGSIQFQQVPGVGNNQPDAFGGGEAVFGSVLPVGLRASGNVAVVNARNLKVRRVVNLERPTPFNAMTCGPAGLPTDPGGCAVHGVTARPRFWPPKRRGHN